MRLLNSNGDPYTLVRRGTKYLYIKAYSPNYPEGFGNEIKIKQDENLYISVGSGYNRHFFTEIEYDRRIKQQKYNSILRELSSSYAPKVTNKTVCDILLLLKLAQDLA
jgi:hypothetical protein